MRFLASGGGLGENIVSATDWAPILTALTTQFSVSNIVAALAAMIGASIGFVFLWWGTRKAYSMITRAFKSGKSGV